MQNTTNINHSKDRGLTSYKINSRYQ